VAQTAQLEPLGCDPPGASALPEDDTFGGGEPLSTLVGQSYGAGQGPGLYVTARDGFRVYLNGERLFTSSTPREAAFVPLTLLPGDNAITLVVAARYGAPAALVQLDELDRSYASDSTWKVSTTPGAGFMRPDYDDSSWAPASDFGAPEALPGCVAAGTFPSDSSAHWIGPALGSDSGYLSSDALSGGPALALRKVIRVAPVGFGESTRGGLGAAPVVVDTWDDLLALARDPETPAVLLLPEGIHDFRDAPRDQPVCPSVCTEAPDKPRYQVLVGNATCATGLVTRTRYERRLIVGSNKTIVGLGRGAQLRSVNVDLGSSQNVIVRNVTLYDVNPELIEADDAFTVNAASSIWLDHCTMKWISDGFTDINADSRDITLSWMHYDGVSPSACEGQHPQAAQITDANVTVHHSFFDHVATHSPAVYGPLARVHIFNNLVSDNLDYAIGSTCGSRVLVQGNTFQRVITPTARSTCADATQLGAIDAPAGSNFYDDDVGEHRGGDGLEPHDAVFSPGYEYSVDPPRESWLEVLSRAGAGGRWALPLSLD
jgi:pectate lyase